jgi:hypothetical protein
MQEYVKYLKNVLGVSQILQSNEALEHVPVATQQPAVLSSKITVWVENFNQFTSEDHTLLNNMLGAMKIPAQDMTVSDLSLKTHDPVSFIEFDLVLNPDSSGSQTYSPQVLHVQKNLKSVVWTFLQQVMQKHKSLN